MTTADIEQRVHTAADAIDGEGGRLTVATVRARAGVSAADATRFLRAWRGKRAAEGSAVASLPPELIEQVEKVAGAMWLQASALASQAHAAIERDWRAQSAIREEEFNELAASLDETERAAEDVAELHAKEVEILGLELQSARELARQVEEELSAAQAEQARLEQALAAESSAKEALKDALEALVERLPQNRTSASLSERGDTT